MRKLLYCWIILISLAGGQSVLADLPVSVDGQALPSLAPMLEKVTPAVVNISTHTRIRIQENPLLNDPFFRHFFNIPDQPRERDNQSLGSGVLIDATKGYVITNNHVIDKADEITVTLRDGRNFTAKLIGTDSETDVALLKITGDNLTALPLANSDKLRVGDFVVAIGNPFGLGQTVTSGIVSALGRTGLGIEGYEDFIQTDASINPGNSGGALVNLRGELIGINTAILAPSGGNVGIGFAIPINMAYQIVQHLADYGKVQRGTLGVHVQNLTPELATAFGLTDNKGAVIAEVQPNSAAAQAGLQVGDIITTINNQPVNSPADVRNRIGLLRVGNKATVTVLRKGRSLTVQAIVSDSKNIKGGQLNAYLEGTMLADDKEGVVITEVTPNSFAGSVGFRKGDVIVGLNRQKVKNLADLTKRLSKQAPPFLLQIRRDDDILTIWLR